MTSDSSPWDRAADDSTELQEQEQQQQKTQAQTSQSERRKLQNRLAQRKFRQKKSQNNKTASQQQADDNSAAASTTASAPSTSNSSLTATSIGSIDLSAESLLDLVSNMNAMPPANSAHPQLIRCSSCGNNNADFPRSGSGQSSRQSTDHHHCATAQPGDFQRSFGSKAGTPHSEMSVFPSDAMSIISTASAISPGADLCSGLMTSQPFCTSDSRPASHMAPSPAMSCNNHTHGSSSSGSSNGSPNFTMPHPWDLQSQSHQTITTQQQPQPYVAAGPGQSWRPLLHVAAQKGHGNVLQILIEHQVDINERDTNGATALHLAVENRHEAAVRMLLQHGADMNACDSQGRSPFYVAVSQGDEDLVRAFLMFGADPRLRVRDHQ